MAATQEPHPPDGPKCDALAASYSLQGPRKKAEAACSSVDVAADLRSKIVGVGMVADKAARPTLFRFPRPKKETAPCYFLKLPAELRNMVYRMVVIPQKTAVRPPRSRLTVRSHRTNTAILRTNRQIYMEARFVLYRNSTLEADIDSTMTFATESEAGKVSMVQQRQGNCSIFLHVLAEVCHVIINLYYFEGMMSYDPRLAKSRLEKAYENVGSQAESICKAIRTRSDARRMRLTINVSHAMRIAEYLRLHGYDECMFSERTRHTVAMFDSLQNVGVELIFSGPWYRRNWRSQLTRDLQARIDSKCLGQKEEGEGISDN